MTTSARYQLRCTDARYGVWDSYTLSWVPNALDMYDMDEIDAEALLSDMNAEVSK